MMDKTNRPMDTFLTILIYFCAIFTVSVLVGIVSYVVVRGLPSISWQLLSTVPSELNETVGILPILINTLYMVVVTLILATPIGIGAAIYLTEYAKKGKLVKIIEFTTESLGGIPSIIYGLFGFVFFCTYLKFQYSLIAGSLTLTIIVLPTIIRTTQEALKSVPASFREGAFGLGANKFYFIRTILVPQAFPGILTAVILSIGRIVGESAALIFTAGIGYQMPKGLFDHLMESGATLTVQMYQYAMRGEELSVSFAIALVLMVVVLGMNITARQLSKLMRRK